MNINLQYTKHFVSETELAHITQKAIEANKLLHAGTGKGNDFLGWINLPNEITDEFLDQIQAKANELRSKIDVMVTVGIGGSYLGAKAVIDSLSDSFAAYNQTKPAMIYAGHNIGEDYMVELRNYLKDKSFAVTVISKSGTTTEPAIAFRILKADLEAKYGKKEAQSRIVAVTDEARGALKTLANQENYQTYVIPDNVGGRYSVLTPVGLFPIAVAGFDIKALVRGAQDMAKTTAENSDKNPAVVYAAMRNALYNKEFNIEILVNYHPKLHFMAEWWKQLYGESEGKDGKGIFTAAVDFSTDLHSLGQYIQDGRRNLFETVISVGEQKYELCVPKTDDDLDKLNYLSGRRIDDINKNAELGTVLAHVEGGVPNIKIEIPKVDEYNIGALIYFFEKGCGISGYVLDVNPFDQPGVEAYKRNMFALLGKPGTEAERTKLLGK